MPLYFAYGANMDILAMADRCPRSNSVGVGRLASTRFFISRDGYASIRRERDAFVHGLIWDLAWADIPTLDRFEDLASGLYRKVRRPVLRAGGPTQAMIYIGRTDENGPPQPGYLEPIIASAEALGFPKPYIAELKSWMPVRGPLKR